METYDPILDALGDRTRRAVLERLREGPKAVVEIARGLPISRPAVSQHLKVLKEAGLVVDREVGTRRIYEVNPAGLSALQQYLERQWAEVLAGFQAHVDKGEKG